MFGLKKICVTLFVLAFAAVDVQASSHWNPYGWIRLFSGGSEGLKEEWEAEGYSCISSAASSNSEYQVIQSKDNELCVFKTADGTMTGCYQTSEDIVGGVWSIKDGKNVFVYSTASEVYKFDASASPLSSTGYGVSNKPAEVYATTLAGGVYIAQEDCSGVPSSIDCTPLSKAVGGPYVTYSGAKVVKFTATKQTVYFSEGGSYTISQADGALEGVKLDKGVIAVHSTGAIAFLDLTMTPLTTLYGDYKSFDMKSTTVGTGLSRTIAVWSETNFEIYELSGSTLTLDVKTPMKDPGSVLGLGLPQYLGITGSHELIIGFDALYSRNSEGEIETSFSQLSVPLPASATKNPTTCKPLMLEITSDGVKTRYLTTYPKNKVSTRSLCTEGEEGCKLAQSITVNDGNGAVIIILAISLSFAIVPTSIYAYKERQYCIATEQSKETTEVRYDREKGVSYDPHHENYANQFAVGEERMKRNDSDDF